MMPDARFAPGDIVQLGSNTHCPGGLAVISEVGGGGMFCYMQLGGPCHARVWFRLNFEDVMATGEKIARPK